MRKALILCLYRILPAAAFPLLLLYVLWRSARDRRYFIRIAERFGFLRASYQRTLRDSVWLHAVSVGEILSSTMLVQQIRAALPDSPVFVSTSTLAGRELAETKLAGIVDGVFYAPIDYVSCVRRVLRRIRPAIVVVLETEIWPNLYRETKRAGCGLVIVNGRISPRAFPRYRRLAWFFSNVLALPDAILAQSEDDRDRYVAAGAPAAKVVCAGNLKYDFNPRTDAAPAAVRDWLERGSGPLWICASTVAPEYAGDVDEDDVVIAAYLELLCEMPGLRLMIAPRKPERFEVCAAKLRDAGIRFARRSALPESVDASVLLLDTIGELSTVFALADVVFMGGTLANRGGHNLLEPAVVRRAVISGPHLENFAEIQRRFREGRGFREIAGPSALTAAVRDLLLNPETRAELGRRAGELAEAQRGATARAVEAIVDARWGAVPRHFPYGPLRPVLWVLSLLWRSGGWVKRSTARSRALPVPVVSVGNIAMGGTGKTPMVRYLAAQLHARGIEVGVLTRGYGKIAHGTLTIHRGHKVDAPAVTGDEPYLISRDGAAHLGIDAHRYEAGLRLLREVPAQVMLLDDGFQHARLARDLDIVLLDGLDPFAGGSVFPTARLREPVTALSRAGAIVITRVERRRFDGVHRVVRGVNAAAPIYHASTVPVAWRSAWGEDSADLGSLRGQTVAAFCGLGNPEGFRATVNALGYEPAFFATFPDHHRYSEGELAELAARGRAAGAGVLLTTEKDAANLPLGVATALPVFALVIGVGVSPVDPPHAPALIELVLECARLRSPHEPSTGTPLSQFPEHRG